MQNDLAWMRPKLAELCGYRLRQNSNGDQFYQVSETEGILLELFRPDEDVAQAVRCLEAVKGDTCETSITSAGAGWHVTLVFPEAPGLARQIVKHGFTMQEAICLAIAAALGWEEGEA